MGPDPDEAQLSAGERLRVFSGCVTFDLLQLPYNQMEKINENAGFGFWCFRLTKRVEK